MELTDKTKKFAPVVLRFGLVAVYLWFGISQITDSSSWTSWVPNWAVSISGMSESAIVLMNGWFETLAVVLLAVGFLTRWVALVLAAHILVITFDIGLTAIGVRDFGLAMATLSLSLFGKDDYSLDSRL